MKWIKNIEASDRFGNCLWFQIHQCDEGIYYHNFLLAGEETWYNGCDCWGFKTLEETTDHCLDIINSIHNYKQKSKY